jgi:hypothetical protein
MQCVNGCSDDVCDADRRVCSGRQSYGDTDETNKTIVKEKKVRRRKVGSGERDASTPSHPPSGDA